MNNRDRFEQAMRSDPLEAAALAIQFSGGCGSKAAAWSWADRAVEAAAQVSVTLDAGHASWPNLNAMTDQLAAAKAAAPAPATAPATATATATVDSSRRVASIGVAV
jgi:hypothetical protein